MSNTHATARTIKLKVELDGQHLKARVFIGQTEHPALCGYLHLRAEDYWDLRSALTEGDLGPAPQALFEYTEDAKRFLLGSAAKRPEPVMHADVPREEWDEVH